MLRLLDLRFPDAERKPSFDYDYNDEGPVSPSSLRPGKCETLLFKMVVKTPDDVLVPHPFCGESVDRRIRRR